MPVHRNASTEVPHGVRLKAAVSVSEMARSLRLSRARLYELINAGVMPQPVYLIRTKRPFYTAELQSVCHRVRESGEGLNGEPIVFYSARSGPAAPKASKAKTKGSKASKPDPKLQQLLDGLKQLGVADPDVSSVEAIVAELYPSGIGTEASGAVLTAVFRALNRRN